MPPGKKLITIYSGDNSTGIKSIKNYTMTELEKLTQDREETEDKIKVIESEISEMNRSIWTKKAIIKSLQKHVTVIDLSISHLSPQDNG